MNLINIDDDITFIGSTSHDQLDAFLKITTILGTSQHLSDVHAVDAGTFQTIRHLIFIDKFGKPIDQSRLSYSRFTNMQRIILLCTAKHLDGTIQFLLSSDERIMFIHLSGDTSYKLVPVIRHITLFFVIIIIILIVHFIWHDASIRSITLKRVKAIYAGKEFSLSVANSLSQQECCLWILQPQHRLHEMSHVNQFSICSHRQGTSRTKHRLEKRWRFWQIFYWWRDPLLLGKPIYQILMHFHTVHVFLLKSLTERELSQECQEQVLRHDKLMVEESRLLESIIHQDTHISGQSHTIHRNNFLSF